MERIYYRASNDVGCYLNQEQRSCNQLTHQSWKEMFAHTARKTFLNSRFDLDLIALTEESIGDHERGLLEGMIVVF